MVINIEHRDGSTKEFVSEKETLEEALSEILDICDKEDDTGYFFELDGADVSELEKNPNFHRISSYGAICEIVEHGLENPER